MTRRSWKCLWVLMLLAVLGAHDAWAHPGSGIVVAADGRIYFVLPADNRIYTVSPGGDFAVFVSDGRVRLPHHLHLDAHGNLYTASDHDGRIWKISPDGDLSLYFPFDGFEPPDWLRVGAGGDPFAIDSAGAVYALHRENGRERIVRVHPSGRWEPYAAPDDTTFGRLHYGTMAWGPTGALYVSTFRRIFKIQEGQVAPVATDFRFEWPHGLVVDPTETIYVADYNRRRVVAVAPNGDVTTVRRFRRPTGIFRDRAGSVYVLDVGRVGVWRIDPEGHVTKMWSRPLSGMGLGMVVVGFVALPLSLTIGVLRQGSNGFRLWLNWTVLGVTLLAIALFGLGPNTPVAPGYRWLVGLTFIGAATVSLRRALDRSRPKASAVTP